MRRRYQSFICDSARWQGFELRPGDVIVTTPPKCGTTWMQMCCLVLVHGPVLPDPLSVLSPWLDQTLDDVETVHTRLGAQTHRRVIKTHTPLEGLPWDPAVSYIGVGRDPRDVALSSANHFRNIRLDAIIAAKEQGGLQADALIPERPADPEAAILHWVNDDPAPEKLGSSLKFTLHHLQALWARRGEPNVALFHYRDLRTDLGTEMRRLAGVLDVQVEERAWAALIDAATFTSMKARADELAPNAHHSLWRDNSEFFAEGRCGAWRNDLSATALARYDERIGELCDDDADFIAWLHR